MGISSDLTGGDSGQHLTVVVRPRVRTPHRQKVGALPVRIMKPDVEPGILARR